MSGCAGLTLGSRVTFVPALCRVSRLTRGFYSEGPGRGGPDAGHGLRASDPEDPAGRPSGPPDGDDQVSCTRPHTVMRGAAT